MRTRFVTIDWSGAKSGERRTIWYAEVRAGRLTRLENGRSRDEVVQHLIDEASHSPQLIAGLDFAFSFPRWFVEEVDASSGGPINNLSGHHVNVPAHRHPSTFDPMMSDSGFSAGSRIWGSRS